MIFLFQKCWQHSFTNKFASQSLTFLVIKQNLNFIGTFLTLESWNTRYSWYYIINNTVIRLKFQGNPGYQFVQNGQNIIAIPQQLLAQQQPQPQSSPQILPRPSGIRMDRLGMKEHYFTFHDCFLSIHENTRVNTTTCASLFPPCDRQV